MQQLAWAWPLIADDRRALGRGPARAAAPLQHPVHRRVRPADPRLLGESARAPAPAPTQPANQRPPPRWDPRPPAPWPTPPLPPARPPPPPGRLLGWDLRRRAPWPTRPILQAGQRRALGRRRVPPAIDPRPHR